MEESLLTKPARDLSLQEAFDLMIFLVEEGEIELVDPVKTDDGGIVISPKPVPGLQMKVRTSMGGVDFFRAKDINPGINGSAGATKAEIFQPTPAFTIVLYRLAKRLAAKWQATQIVWGGIGAGSGKNAKDCHMTGHCVDFYGATTAAGVQFDVRRDWWSRTVYRQDNGKPLATTAPLADHWLDTTDTYFRLAISQEPQDLTPWQFFGDVYQFIVEECTPGNNIAADLFRNGSALQAGTIMHPDYPVAGDPGPGRRTHNDHIHFQLGNAYE
jgi:hypothetical protein